MIIAAQPIRAAKYRSQSNLPPWPLHFSLFAIAAFSTFVYIPVGEVAISFVDLLTPIIFLGLMVASNRILSSYFVFYFLFVVLMFFLTSVAAEYPSLGKALLALRLLFIASPMALIIGLPSGYSDFVQRVIMLSFWSLLLACSLGVIMYTLDIQVNDKTQRLWLGNGLGSQFRAGGIVGNSGDFGQTAGLLLSLALVQWKQGKIGLKLWILASLIAFYSIVGASSRSALLFVLVFFAIYFLVGAKRRPLTVVVAIIFVFLSTIMIFNLELQFVSAAVQRNFLRLDIFNFSGQTQFLVTGRLDAWQLVLQSTDDIRFAGLGYKASLNHFGVFIDNIFLLILFEGGPIVFIIFLLFWAGLGFNLLRILIEKRSTIGWAALAFFASFLLRNLTGGAISNWSTAPTFFLLTAAFMYLHNEQGTHRKR